MSKITIEIADGTSEDFHLCTASQIAADLRQAALDAHFSVDEAQLRYDAARQAETIARIALRNAPNGMVRDYAKLALDHANLDVVDAAIVLADALRRRIAGKGV